MVHFLARFPTLFTFGVYFIAIVIISIIFRAVVCILSNVVFQLPLQLNDGLVETLVATRCLLS